MSPKTDVIIDNIFGHFLHKSETKNIYTVRAQGQARGKSFRKSRETEPRLLKITWLLHRFNLNLSFYRVVKTDQFWNFKREKLSKKSDCNWNIVCDTLECLCFGNAKSAYFSVFASKILDQSFKKRSSGEVIRTRKFILSNICWKTFSLKIIVEPS